DRQRTTERSILSGHRTPRWRLRALHPESPPLPRWPRSSRLQVEIRPHWYVVGRLLPGAHIAVDADIGQAVAGLRREQEVVDPDAPVLLPGARLVVPERVEVWLVSYRAQRVRQPKAEQRVEGLPGLGL